MHLVNDLSLENKCSRIEMVPDSIVSNHVRDSMEASYFNEADMNRDINRSRSRSNPGKNELLTNMQMSGGDQGTSPRMKKNLVMDDEDEITERIRLQGERLVQMPEIMQNQAQKRLEKVMMEQKENIGSSMGRNMSGS